MDTPDDHEEEEEVDRYVPASEEWPEAHEEVYATADSKEKAAEIFQRHGMPERDARDHARLIFGYDQARLKALPPEAEAA